MSNIPNYGKLSDPNISEFDHCQGSIQSPIILIEYGSYQCPDCCKISRIIHDIQQQLGEQLCFVFRHFPQSSLYPQAQRAAEAAEVAGEQNMFWQMHEILFKNQHSLEDGFLVEYAVNIGLDMSQFLRSFSARSHNNRIQRDIQSGLKSGVNYTPVFFINGNRYENNYDRESLLSLLDSLIC